MSKITPNLGFTLLKKSESEKDSAGYDSIQRFIQMLQNKWQELAVAFNGRVSFGNGINVVSDNIDGVWINTTTPAVANTDFTVTHNLSRIPNGYIVMKKSAACDIYDGTIASTITQITLKATVISINIRLFII